jgi:dolichol-phosphate mannosyltransferase
MTIPDISFAIPCHNEEGNLKELVRRIDAQMAATGKSHEIVVTDDRSSDGSWEVLKSIAATHPHVRALRLNRNSGESAASYTAITNTLAPIVVTMDADLQNDPDDLPKFFAALQNADCVCGTRQAVRDDGDNWIKTVTSKVANAIRSSVLGDAVTDAGCTYRAFKRSAFTGIPFFKGVHRFIPIIMAFRGLHVVEVPVVNRERTYGSSHYGFGILARKGAVVDMMGVRWLKSRMIRFDISERTGKE